jgi:hypothetical protein
LLELALVVAPVYQALNGWTATEPADELDRLAKPPRSRAARHAALFLPAFCLLFWAGPAKADTGASGFEPRDGWG